jgi:branched-chain amino acid transport system ATP-binding protein
MLNVSSIHTFIGQFHILEGVSLEVPKGAITVLLGRNGAGKTTTLKSILGLTPPREGIVDFKGNKIQGKRAYDVAAMGIGYVPEHRAIFSNLSVAENLKIAERKKGDLDKLPGNHLSGGQQQMLAVARALVPENDLLLIDEPSEGLAPILIQQMMEAIRSLSSKTTVLLVEQNFRMASQLAEYYYIIDDGKSVQHGRMAELVNDTETVHRYLGTAVGALGGKR